MERAPILRADVQAVGGDWASASGIEHALLDHQLRAAGAFLAGLEHKGDIAMQLLAVLAQHARRPNQPRGMQVVATGVHVFIDRRKGAAGLLMHLQGVHVRAQQHRNRPLAALAAAQHRHYGAEVLPHMNLQRQALERFKDLFLGARQVQPDFRVAVQIAPNVLQVLHHGFAHVLKNLRRRLLANARPCHRQRRQLLRLARDGLTAGVVGANNFRGISHVGSFTRCRIRQYRRLSTG